MKTSRVYLKPSTLGGLILLFAITIGMHQVSFAAEPTVPASLLTATVSNCNEVDLSWSSGDGTRRLVVGSADAPVSSFPVDGTSYVAGNIFGSGTNLGNNNYVIYSSPGSSVTVTALNANKTYYFAVFEYNGTGGSTDYLTSIYPEADTIPFGVAIQITASDTIMCAGSSVTLDVSGAVNYFWSPASGLSGTTGSSVTASPSATTKYSVLGTDGSGCQAYERITLTVNPRPTVTLSSQPSSCVDDSPRTLSGGSPASGMYSGPGVSGGSFDPSAAGTGFHTITYTYSNIQGCSASATRTITVYALPSVTLSSFSSRCINGGNLTLTGGSPGGGTYSGTGISSGVFNPVTAGAGTHTVTYTYSDSHSCTNTASSSITVNPAPTVTLPNYSTVCINTPAFALTGGSPAGGVYTGQGVSSGTFNPVVAGVGSHTIAYRYTNAQGCSDSTTASIQVGGLPSVTVSPYNPVCVSTSPFALSGGNPLGGVFSGSGVTSNVFYPAVADTGDHTITYTYTNSNGCVNTDSTSILVTPAPSVSLAPFTDVCANTGPVSLNTGTPSGGIYSGPAVSGTTFYTGIAGSGTHAIVYTIVDSNSCAASDTQNIEVRPVPVVSLGADRIMCLDEAIELDAGPGFSSYAWNTGANTRSITVDSSGRGSGTFPFRVNVTNSYGCVGKDTVLVTIDICSGLDPLTENDKKIFIYPNPFSSSFQLMSEERISLYLYDQSGRLLESYENRNGLIRAGENLAAGIYLAEIRMKGSARSIMLIKTE